MTACLMCIVSNGMIIEYLSVTTPQGCVQVPIAADNCNHSNHSSNWLFILTGYLVVLLIKTVVLINLSVFFYLY